MVEKSVGIWNLCGFLEWVERAGFFEPLALNAVIIALGAEHEARSAFELRNVPFGSAVPLATHLSLGLL
jgi:hypothetical protein